jgi:hypothetical protein
LFDCGYELGPHFFVDCTSLSPTRSDTVIDPLFEPLRTSAPIGADNIADASSREARPRAIDRRSVDLLVPFCPMMTAVLPSVGSAVRRASKSSTRWSKPRMCSSSNDASRGMAEDSITATAYRLPPCGTRPDFNRLRNMDRLDPKNLEESLPATDFQVMYVCPGLARTSLKAEITVTFFILVCGTRISDPNNNLDSARTQRERQPRSPI